MAVWVLGMVLVLWFCGVDKPPVNFKSVGSPEASGTRASKKEPHSPKVSGVCFPIGPDLFRCPVEPGHVLRRELPDRVFWRFSCGC